METFGRSLLEKVLDLLCSMDWRAIGDSSGSSLGSCGAAPAERQRQLQQWLPALFFQLPSAFAPFFSPIGLWWCFHTSFYRLADLKLYFSRSRSVVLHPIGQSTSSCLANCGCASCPQKSPGTLERSRSRSLLYGMGPSEYRAFISQSRHAKARPSHNLVDFQ